MARYALVKDGIVDNVVMAEEVLRQADADAYAAACAAVAAENTALSAAWIAAVEALGDDDPLPPEPAYRPTPQALTGYLPPPGHLLIESDTAGPGWLYDGSALHPPPEPPRVFTLDDYTRAIRMHLDAVVGQRGYDSILSAASYDGDPIYGAEGAAAKAWRSAVWAYAYAELARVRSGQRSQPTPTELVAELPTLLWPED